MSLPEPEAKAAAAYVDTLLAVGDEQETSQLREVFERVSSANYERFEFAILNAIPRERAAMEKVFGRLVKIPVSRGSYSQEMAVVTKANGHSLPVVVAGVTGAGTVYSAAVTASLTQQLPFLKTVVLVGIAAGQPNLESEERDVWLGDVVVGDSVVQYDHIKRESADKIECRGTSMPLPGPKLLQAARGLQAEMESHPDGPWSWEGIIQEALSSWSPGLRPEEALDPNGNLRTYDHKLHRHGSSRPHLRIGKIGSANILLKDAAFRDEISREHKTLAYEMEGAGLAIAASEFGLQYLIVRGICDYADERKADDWQRYAALAAGAVAKSLFVQL